MENAHILFVDDDLDILLEPIVKMIEDAGFKVSRAYNGVEALQRVKEVQPNLIILDYKMPLLDGVEVIRQLRATGNTIPIILLTVHHSDKLHVESLGLGADDYLRKPIRPSVLLAHVKARLQRERSQSNPLISQGLHFSNTEPTRAIKIFYCYARKDKALRDELEKHLEPLRRSGQITLWHDREILPGTEWKREIDTHLNTSNIILLLVSPNFIHSNYCYGIEMRRALERHKTGEAHVIPIILRPVDWKGTPIGELQVLPREGRPISMWRDRDDAFLDVERGIAEVVRKLFPKMTKKEGSFTIIVETPSGERFEADVSDTTEVSKLATDFFEFQNWPLQDQRGYTHVAVVELINPENLDDTKRLNIHTTLSEAGVRDGDILRIYPIVYAG